MKTSLRSIVRRTVLSLSILSVLVSCTVKEDRSVCPCVLEVEFLDKEQIKGPVLLVGWTQQEQVFEDTIDAAGHQGPYVRKVPRSMMSFGAVAGISDCEHTGHYVIIPQSQECDSLYAYTDTVDCTGEKALTTVVFHKQFATVNLRFSNGTLAAQDYSFVVESNSSGMDVLTCKPVEGAFRFEPEVDDGGSVRFRIPRQGDDTLVLTVRHLSSGASARFALGKYICSIGYDWEADDLQDIYITLDIARGKVGVGVADWEEIEDFELATVEL